MIDNLKGFKEVFSKPKYIILFLVSALLFYMASVLITDFPELKRVLFSYGFSFKLIFLYFIGFPVIIGWFTAISLFVIAFLFGSYISLAIYKTNQVKKFSEKKSFWGSLGIFFGFLAPGCAACGLGLASFFGLSGLIIALPFHGMEISVIALLLLGYANFNVAGKINKNSCSIKN